MPLGTDETRPRSLTTGETYRAYDRVIRRVEEWLSRTNAEVVGCVSSDVRARIVQRIVEETATGFTQYAASSDGAGGDRTLDLGGIRICTATGEITVSARQRWANLLQFAAGWTRLLQGFIGGLAAPSPAHSARATLLLSWGGTIEESDARFVRFCKDGPIAVLRRASRIIVETTATLDVATSTDFIYTPRPLLYAATRLVGRRSRLGVLLAHLTAPLRYARAIAVNPLAVLLGRDLAFTPAMGWLDRHGVIEAMVTSTSAFTSQPLWMKGLRGQRSKLHMVWYSQNFVPKVYAGEEEPSDLPAARHMRVDVHWVWTDGFKDYLRTLGQSGEIQVVGPILWFLPEEVTGLSKDSLNVAVFDINPVLRDDVAFGAAKNYYSLKTISQFVTDIVLACDSIARVSGKNVSILLKHKRATLTGHHDPAYLDFLTELEAAKPGFTLIDHRTNTFGLLRACDVSISVPYTSVPYVAASLGKPAVYYDPFGELVPIFERDPLVHFAAGPDELEYVLQELVGERH